MFLKLLLVVLFILIGLTSTNCNDSGTGGKDNLSKKTAGKTSGLVLSSAAECARECKNGEPAKICYYNFTLELYPVLGRACQRCTPNYTNTIESNCQCVTANGVERTMLAVNRMLPGPSIQVCLGDKIVVDVDNRMEGMETSFHWHGVFQKGTQYYDGVPLLTQCPIIRGNTFRYQFYAHNSGTHLWHTHSGLQRLDGLYGSLIVREPSSEDPNKFLYDDDLLQHVMVISDWRNTQATERFPGTRNIYPGQMPESILVNGKGQYTNPTTGNVTTCPSEVFTITLGRRYRFRMINAFSSTCPAEVKIQGHTMTVIAADGVPVRPRVVDTIIFSSGERYDFVVNANQRPDAYWIQVRGLLDCTGDRIQQTAILKYEGTGSKPHSAQPTYDNGLPQTVVLDSTDGKCSAARNNALCVSDLKSADPIDKGIIESDPDIKLYIPFNFVGYTVDKLYQPNTYDHFRVAVNGAEFVATVDNIRFVDSPSPPISQIDDIPPDTFCNAHNPPTNCRTTCSCTNIYNIRLNDIVELIMIDESGLNTTVHPFHLHGYAFNVMKMGHSSDLNVTKISAKHVRDYDSKYPIKRNFDRPLFKDTVSVPFNGYVILRFRANNPGYWLFHCHFLYHEINGMRIVFHVGDYSDLPPIPSKFPVCGDYKPPITPIQ